MCIRDRPTTYINLVGDVMFAIGLMYPAIGVPMAIAGLAYTMLGWKEDKKEKRMENFYSFAKYLNSDEAQEYMKCQRETGINAQISNITVNETERIAKFTISLDKPHITDVEIKLFTVEGTATEDEDYRGVKKADFTKVIIPAGETNADFNVEISQDGKYEGKEEFLLVGEYINLIPIGKFDYKAVDKTIAGLATILRLPTTRMP